MFDHSALPYHYVYFTILFPSFTVKFTESYLNLHYLLSLQMILSNLVSVLTSPPKSILPRLLLTLVLLK